MEFHNPIVNNIKYSDEENYIDYNNSLFTREQILLHFQLNPTKIENRTTNGNFNNVYFYKNYDESNIISYRRTTTHLFALKTNNQGKVMFLMNNYFLKSKNLYLDNNVPANSKAMHDYINNTIQNNVNASKYGLCPELYFIGFEKYIVNENECRFYFVVLNKGYNYSLYEYYTNDFTLGTRNKQDNAPLLYDEIIKDYIITLIYSLIFQVKLICFDIKPQNCVLLLDDLGGQVIDVKFIDFDADSCFPIEIGSNLHAIKNIHILFMSMHCYKWLQWNIFYEYIRDEIANNELIKSEISDFFCKSNHTRNFLNYAYHYFFLDELRDNQGNMLIDLIDDEMCQDTVNRLIKNAIKIKGGRRHKKIKIKKRFTRKKRSSRK